MRPLTPIDPGFPFDQWRCYELLQSIAPNVVLSALAGDSPGLHEALRTVGAEAAAILRAATAHIHGRQETTTAARGDEMVDCGRGHW